MVEVLQRSRTLQLPGNESLGLEKVRALSGEDYEHLHAEAILQDGDGKRAAVLFGPEHSAISAAQVAEAHREAYNNGFDLLCIFGFAIDAKARELIGSPDDAKRRLRLRCIYVNVTSDVVMSDLLKTNKSSEIFSVTGLTDVAVTAAGADPTGRPLYRAAVRGLDIFRPHDLETESIAADNLPCWMLDTDYNGLAFMALVGSFDTEWFMVGTAFDTLLTRSDTLKLKVNDWGNCGAQSDNAGRFVIRVTRN